MTLRLATTMAFVALTAVAYAQTPSPAPMNPPSSSSSPASGAPSQTSNGSSASTISKPDKTFATKAAQAGAAEIADAQIALQNSSRQDVKDFAQRMVDDHTKANDQLKSIAGSEGIALPAGESSSDQKETTALQKLNGAAFDRQYIEGQRKAHREAVALFSKESQNGKDSQLKSFAGQTLPTLQEHLKMITAMPLRQSQKTSSTAP